MSSIQIQNSYDPQNAHKGALYLVATPIGNLEPKIRENHESC